jgi:hypothetical protein
LNLTTLDIRLSLFERTFDSLSGWNSGYWLSFFGLRRVPRSSSEGCAVPLVVSDPVADVAAAVDKPCAADGR